MQIDIVNSANNITRYNNEKTDIKEQDNKEVNPITEDFPDTYITKLNHVDDFPEITKESGKNFLESSL
jgi:hypothetical protein